MFAETDKSIGRNSIVVEEAYLNKILSVPPMDYETYCGLTEKQDFSRMDLFTLCMLYKSGDSTGQLQTRIKQLMAEGCNDQNPSNFQTLFELAYEYGGRSNGITGFENVRRVIGDIYQEYIEGQTICTAEEKTYLPEDTVEFIRGKSAKQTNGLAKTVFLAGYSAGVVFANPDAYMDMPDILDGSQKQVEIKARISKEEVVEGIKISPGTVVDLIIPQVESIATPTELEKAESDFRSLMGTYYKERIKKVIDGKKLSRRTKDRNLFSVWSLEYEDRFFEQAARLQDPECPVKKKDVQKTASRLGELQLAREVLANDLSTGVIPEDVDFLVKTYLSEQQDDNFPSFESFITEQRRLTTVGEKIERFLEQSAYWKESGRRQVITPDTYQISERQLKQISSINSLYTTYFGYLTNLYNQSVENMEQDEYSRELVSRLEGGLPEPLIPLCRNLMRLRGSIDSLRFDLIPDKNGWFWVGEAQIISGGTPPAILYREAFENVGNLNKPVSEGILPKFIKRIRKFDEEPFLVILYSDRPYSSDISKTTSFAGNKAFEETLRQNGVTVTTAFSSELKRGKTGRLFLKSGDLRDRPITTIYNRADWISEKAVPNLQEQGFNDLLSVVSENGVDIFPQPYPILFGKGVYALLWDKDYEYMLRQGLGNETYNRLRSFTPPTYWVYPGNNSLDLQSVNPTEWIRKGSYEHATRNLVMGPEEPAKLIEAVGADMQNPFSGTIQRYIDSQQPSFRILKRMIGTKGKEIKAWTGGQYRLRVEPTSIDGEICEVFVTGNPERVVHGRENSIMTLATIKD